MLCVQMNSVTELQHLQWIWQKCWIMSSRHGQRFRPGVGCRKHGSVGRTGSIHSQVQWTLWGEVFLGEFSLIQCEVLGYGCQIVKSHNFLELGLYINWIELNHVNSLAHRQYTVFITSLLSSSGMITRYITVI